MIISRILQSRCEVIMYTVALLTFMAIGGFPSFVEDVKVDSSPIQKWPFLLKSNLFKVIYYYDVINFTQIRRKVF